LFLFLLLNSTAEGTIKGRILDSPAQKKRKEIKEKKERKKGLAALIDHSKMIISWLA
jgi:hypothetical protein